MENQAQVAITHRCPFQRSLGHHKLLDDILTQSKVRNPSPTYLRYTKPPGGLAIIVVVMVVVLVVVFDVVVARLVSIVCVMVVIVFILVIVVVQNWFGQ